MAVNAGEGLAAEKPEPSELFGSSAIKAEAPFVWVTDEQNGDETQWFSYTSSRACCKGSLLWYIACPACHPHPCLSVTQTNSPLIAEGPLGSRDPVPCAIRCLPAFTDPDSLPQGKPSWSTIMPTVCLGHVTKRSHYKSSCAKTAAESCKESAAPMCKPRGTQALQIGTPVPAAAAC